MDEMIEEQKTRETAKSIDALIDQSIAMNGFIDHMLQSVRDTFFDSISLFNDAALDAAQKVLQHQQGHLTTARAYAKVLAGEIEDTKDEQKMNSPTIGYTGHLLTTRQAAEFLGIGERTIREWIHCDYKPLNYLNLPNISSPRFTREMLIEYVNSCSVYPQKRKEGK